MNWSYLIVGAITVAGTILGWLWRHSVRLAVVEKDVSNLNNTHHDFTKQVLNHLVRIEEKLDRKADKS